MNEKPEPQDLERSSDPLVKYQKTNSDLVSLTEPINNAIDESIVRHIQQVETPEDVEKWLQLKDRFELQKERKIQYLEKEKKALQERRLKIFDEIRLTIFSGLLFVSGISMVFLKKTEPGLVLIVLAIMKPLKYSIPETFGLFQEYSQKSRVFSYLFTLISLFLAILIWADVSQGTQQVIIIFISLIVLFSLSVIQSILGKS
ncbi:MAG: hypothetical protein AB4290_11895 [Spirulina sp.]